MAGELYLARASDADLLDLGWARRDHTSTDVELRITARADGGLDVRCSWFSAENSTAGFTARELVAAVNVPLDADQALELAFALCDYLGLGIE